MGDEVTHHDDQPISQSQQATEEVALVVWIQHFLLVFFIIVARDELSLLRSC